MSPPRVLDCPCAKAKLNRPESSRGGILKMRAQQRVLGYIYTRVKEGTHPPNFTGIV